MGKKRANDNRPIIVDEVACDWLNLTTYSEETSKEWYAILDKLNASLPSKIAFSQYSGVQWDEGIAIVEGVQAKGVHHMLTASGSTAQEVLNYIREWSTIDIESLKCTRIDVQITLMPVMDRPSLVNLAMATKAGDYGEWLGRGRPKVEALFGDTGNTMYIGSRESETFCRIYDKEVQRKMGAKRMYERYEVEYKGTRAQHLFTRVMNTPIESMMTPMKEALKGHIERLPPGLSVLLSAGAMNKWELKGAYPELTPRGKGNKVKWVETIRDALAQCAQLPGKEGESVRRILVEAFARGIHGDDYTDLNKWAIVAPEGYVYNPEGIRYNPISSSGGVTITDIHNSTITIDRVTGNNYTEFPDPQPFIKTGKKG